MLGELARCGLDEGARKPFWKPHPLALNGRGIAQVDLKRGVGFDRLAKALVEADAVDRSVVITYSLEDAIALHRRLPQLMISAGLDDPDDLAALDDAGVDRSRITAWLGLGAGDPALDAYLADRGIETSYGDFRAERNGTIDYRSMAGNGAEVLSVDKVRDAALALDARAELSALLEGCAAISP